MRCIRNEWWESDFRDLKTGHFSIILSCICDDVQCEVSSKGSFSSQGISRFTFSLAASYKAALKSNNQSNTKGTYRDADIYCHPHAPPRGRSTLPATGVALRWVIWGLRPELPREPVQPEQRRRRIWRIWRISIREIVDIDQPVKPNLCCTLF